MTKVLPDICGNTNGVYDQFYTEMKKRYPVYTDALDRAHKEFGAVWDDEFGTLIVRMCGSDPRNWEPAMVGYVKFCIDALKSQIYFERHRRYKATSYVDATNEYYQNKDFMFHSYLPGMILSHYIWMHHHRMLQWYRSVLREIKIQNFAEVGTGCGLYSKETLERSPECRGIGFDISEHSLAFTENLIKSFSLNDRYSTRVQDIITKTPTAYPLSKSQNSGFDLVICQEVLEHLENPDMFCKALFAMTRPGGYAYITAAINAAHVDHIYLYRSLDDVLDQIRSAGFEVLKSREELAYLNKPKEITPSLGGAICYRPE